MYLSCLHSTDANPELILLPMGQVRSMARSINRASVLRIEFMRAFRQLVDDMEENPKASCAAEINGEAIGKFRNAIVNAVAANERDYFEEMCG